MPDPHPPQLPAPGCHRLGLQAGLPCAGVFIPVDPPRSIREVVPSRRETVRGRKEENRRMIDHHYQWDAEQ